MTLIDDPVTRTPTLDGTSVAPQTRRKLVRRPSALGVQPGGCGLTAGFVHLLLPSS
jgi:hypothetical protein